MFDLLYIATNIKTGAKRYAYNGTPKHVRMWIDKDLGDHWEWEAIEVDADDERFWDAIELDDQWWMPLLKSNDRRSYQDGE